MLPFGLNNPMSTGAPGSSYYGGSTDATNQPGQAEGEMGAYGAQAPQQTGSPGSQGATTANEPAGASYTVDSYGWAPREAATGGSTDTQGAANNYGSNTMPGVAGIGQPSGTGAPASGGGSQAPNHNHGAY